MEWAMNRKIGLKRSKRGGMPLAVIAIVLMIIASAYGVMLANNKETEDNADNIVTELGSLDSAIESTKTSVERGLGEIIFQISTDPNGGSLDERTKTFEELSEKWISSSYPSVDKGVSVSIKNFDFALVAESLKMSTSDSLTEGFTPSYLKATGHYTASFISGSGTSVRTTEISTDGTCALPLVAEQGSLFEIMTSGNGSALSQMMTHQLTALAQYRVLNGYGALAEYGDMGTMSIITAEDVRSAYASSMDVLEMLVFRCPSGDVSADMERIDLTDHLITDDGQIELDLSAIYSQALISIIDDLVLKWSDYLYGNLVFDAADSFLDSIKNAWDSLKGFFKGSNEFSAAPYIEHVLNNNGLDVDHYRYLFSGKSSSFDVQNTTVTVNGSSFTIPSLHIVAEYPSVDLMSWNGISKFKSDYRNETNEIREWIRNVINSAAVSIGTSKSLGTVRISVDPSDDVTFMTSVQKAVDDALDKSNSEIERIMTSAISEQGISDPFYSAIFGVISEDLNLIYGMEVFKNNIYTEMKASLSSYFQNSGLTVNDDDLKAITEHLMKRTEAVAVMDSYDDSVRNCLMGLSALERIPGGQPGMIKDICRTIFKTGLLFTDMITNVPDRIRTLCAEAVENSNINAYSGILDLPSSDHFTLIDGNGGTSTEKLSFSSTGSPTLSIKGPNENLSDCIHYVGFNENTGASYATVFKVIVRDDIEYTVSGSGILESAMGTSDSVFKGSSKIDLELKIVVASGWELVGVRDYAPSNTLLEDVWNALIELLSPLLEPLRKIMSMIADALSVLGSALLEFSKYVAAVVERLYNALMGPIEKIAAFIDEKLNSFFNSVVEAAVDAVQWIVGIDLSKQTVGFSFMGFTLTFTTKLSTLVSNTKTLLTIAMSMVIDKLTISGSLTIKQKGTGSSKEMILTGSAGIEGDGWGVFADIDPLMKTTNHMLSIYGEVRGVKFDILLPDAVQYKEAQFSLSDVPAIGVLLSNIPTPIPGVKASIDAGIELKYNIPFETGILINEFELNPPNEDKDNEWVELYNATRSTVDLNGYTIHAGSNPKTKVYTISDLRLSPGQKEVIILPGSFLNNSGSTLISSGECVILNDPEGNEVDKTPAKKDSKNDNYTWQRVADGASDWSFANGTPGSANGGGLLNGEMVKAQIIKILKDSAVKTMGDMKKLTSTGDLAEFFKAAIHHALVSGIEMLAGCLVEASVFVSLDITDATSTVCSGVRIALFIDSGFVEDGLKYLVGEIESILLNIENPFGLTPKEVLTDNIYLGVTVYFGMNSPKFLKDIESYPEVKLGIHINSNVSGLCRILGSDVGKWKVTAGVIIMDCPSAILPSALKVDKTLETDLWLIRATFAST